MKSISHRDVIQPLPTVRQAFGAVSTIIIRTMGIAHGYSN